MADDRIMESSHSAECTDLGTHTPGELRLMRTIAAGLDLWDNVEEIDRRIADGCDCPCHQTVQPGLIPCPRCLEGEEA